MELGRRAAGVYVWRNGARELWRRAIGVQTWRYGARELWRLAAGVQTWRHRDIEIGSLRGELWNSGGILQACRRENFDGVCSSCSTSWKVLTGFAGHRTE